jgi:hypothetical protein
LVVLTGLTAAVFGLEAYRSYACDVLPEIYWFRVCWNNNSLAGFWCRLFDPAPWKGRIFSLSAPLWYSPALAQAGYWASAAAVTSLTALGVHRAQSRDEDDLAFGLAVAAMLLVSPIVWEHYFLLLLIPLAVLWVNIKPHDCAGWILGFVLLGVWVSPLMVWLHSGVGGRVARPLENLTLISYQFYALLALFALSATKLRGARRRAARAVHACSLQPAAARKLSAGAGD